jgi:membrane-bound lytic murein transglycosylase F
MNRFACVAAALLFAAAPAQAQDDGVDSPRWPGDYDTIFQKYTKRFFGPHFEWRWFKAQGIAESTLKADARSGVGAVGLMQIMPATFTEIQRSNPYFLDPHSPRWNIAAGIFYDRYLFRHQVWASLADEERLLLAFASYNAGLGGALRAFKLTPPPVDSWIRVAPQAPRETRGYVARIVALKTGASLSRTPRQRGITRQLTTAAARAAR